VTKHYCDICGDEEEGPWPEPLVVAAQDPKPPAWLEGREKLVARIWICWACWNDSSDEWERASLIALATLNSRLSVHQGTRFVVKAIRSMVRWL